VSQHEGEADAEVIIQEARRRRTRIFAALGAVLLVACAGVGLASLLIQRDQDRRPAEGWGNPTRRLWGDVLAEGRTPGAAVRAAQLAAIGLPETKRSEPGAAPWPMRCSSYAYGVKERLEQAGRAQGDGKAISEAADELGRTLKDSNSI